MIKTYLKPLFKRFLGLFLSMAAVSMLAISLMICFLTGIGNLAIELTEYRDAYGDADGMIDTSLVERSKFAGLEDLPEIVDADSRLVSYGNLKREDGRVLTCRVLSHHSQDSIYQLYFDQQDLREGSPDVFLESVYAEHNGYQLGDVIQIGYYGFFLDCRVGAIVKTPESMYVRAEDYIWSDNYDFGYLYLEESLFSNLLLSLQSKIEDRIAENPEFEAYYEKAKESLGDSLPDLRAVTADTVASFGNQILLKAAPGVSQQAAVDAAVNYLKDQGVNVKSAKRGVETPSAMYMERAMKQLNVAAIFLPVFFFGVALVVTVLFINQIIKIMTPEIGTMVSIGISPKSITALFSVFILLMSLFSILLGVGIGWGLLSYVLTMFLKVYNLPAISFGLLWYVVLAASGLTILVGQGAVAVSSLLIYRITPKDAMLNNETKRKPLPKWIDRSLEKMPTITRLSVNSMLQNKRRFLVSVFSMIAAFTMISLTSNFYVAKDELINQTTSYRMAYDVQTYVTGTLPDGFQQAMDQEENILRSEIVDYTYLPVMKDGEISHLQAMGVGDDRTEMIVVPDEKGRGNLDIPAEGIVLATTYAETLQVDVGDFLNVNGHSLKIVSLSRQYANSLCYLSKQSLESLEVAYATSILAKVKDQNAYSSFLSEQGIMCLSVFTDRLVADFNSRLGGTDVMLAIMIGFGFLMGLVILAIVSQNSLMEQKKPISIMRALGFSLLRISHLWTWQSLSQLLLSTILAIPLTVLFSNILFQLASSSVQVYPFIFSWPVYLIAFGFILVIIMLTHLFAMRTIANWNLADNTRTRE